MVHNHEERKVWFAVLTKVNTGGAPRADDAQIMVWSAAYLKLAASGELAKRVEAAYRHLEKCDLCARYCHANRRKSIEGAVCRFAVSASPAAEDASRALARVNALMPLPVQQCEATIAIPVTLTVGIGQAVRKVHGAT